MEVNKRKMLVERNIEVHTYDMDFMQIVKNTIYVIVSVLALVGCTGQKPTINTTTDETLTQEVIKEEVMVGAYSEGHEPTEEELALFKSTYKGDFELTPCSVSEQVVAGTNYAFTCKDKEEKEYIVTIFVPLPCNQDTQKTVVTSIKEVK